MIFYPQLRRLKRLLLVKMCSHAHLSDINSAARLWHPASRYLLRPCSRARLPRLMYKDVRYADFAIAPTVGAGAKIGENKFFIRTML